MSLATVYLLFTVASVLLGWFVPRRATLWFPVVLTFAISLWYTVDTLRCSGGLCGLEWIIVIGALFGGACTTMLMAGVIALSGRRRARNAPVAEITPDADDAPTSQPG